MPLAGHTFLALWNDIADARVVDYDRWHTLEHVPERASVTGFLGARRYVNRDHASHRYFTLYDVDTLAAFDHPEYRDLVDHPTPWTLSMRPDFSNFVRAICSVTYSEGTGMGGAIGCLCIPAHVADADLYTTLDRSRNLPRIIGAHAGTRTEPAVAMPFKPASAVPVPEFDRVALVEGLDQAACTVALSALRSSLALESLATHCTSGTFDLAFVFPGSDPAEAARHRRSGWTRRTAARPLP
jgi:hypothetical protein